MTIDLPPPRSADSYVALVRARLEAGGAHPDTAQLPRGPALVGHRAEFRWRWMATKLHLLTVVVPTLHATGPGLEEFAGDALDYADAMKGQFRGLQVGVAAVPVLVAEQADPGAIEVARTRLIRKWAKFAWPTLVDLSTNQVHLHEGRVAIGAVYSAWIRQQIAHDLPDPRTL